MVSCNKHTDYEGECQDCKKAYAEYKERQRTKTPVGEALPKLVRSIDDRTFFCMVHNSTCVLLQGVTPDKFVECYDLMFDVVWEVAKKKKKGYLEKQK